MTDVEFAGLCAAGVAVPVITALVSLVVAYNNAYDVPEYETLDKRKAERLTVKQALAAGTIWIIGSVVFGAMIAVCATRYTVHTAVTLYSIVGGALVVVSLLCLAHAMLHFRENY